LKISANVKIAMQCFDIFGGDIAKNAPPTGCAHDCSSTDATQHQISPYWMMLILMITFWKKC